MFLVTGSSCNIETMKGGRSFYWTNVKSCIDVVYIQKRYKVRFAKIFGIFRTFLLSRRRLDRIFTLYSRNDILENLNTYNYTRQCFFVVLSYYVSFFHIRY